jgi:hypothetical protein
MSAGSALPAALCRLRHLFLEDFLESATAQRRESCACDERHDTKRAERVARVGVLASSLQCSDPSRA